MRQLERIPIIRTIVDARHYDQFGKFCSGKGEHEGGVDNLVHRQHHGIANNKATMVVMEDPLTQELMGTCGHRPEAVKFTALAKSEVPLPTWVPTTEPDFTVQAVYIHVIGLEERFRDCRLPDGGRLGSHLLRGAMREVARDYITKPLPVMFAFVAEDNYPSHRLFEAHSFGLIAPRRNGHDTIRYRPAGLELG